ncbi:MAG: alpha/beta hydrolase [Armatimonadota bacterium]|nr:alpha/beta hydrolase [Armatimonadota bacterium]MDR5696409.1 alpha/beta hydrolase [Armatimonadota bacterium]
MDVEVYRKAVRVGGAGGTVTLSVVDVPGGQPDRTMVFVHGLGGEAGHWQRQLTHFYGRARLIAPDLRGHGRSERPPGGYTIDRFRADLAAMMDALAVGRAVLVAHSFGGAVAAEFAASAPERVEAIVLIATPARFRLRLRWRLVLRLPAPLLALLAPLGSDRAAAPAYVLHRCYREALVGWSGPRTLGRLSVPALVVYGDRDPTVHVRYLEQTAHAIPGAERLQLPGRRHLLMRDDAEEVNRAIEAFLVRRLRASASGGRA